MSLPILALEPSGADDTAALQTAVNLSPQGFIAPYNVEYRIGGTVFLPHGFSWEGGKFKQTIVLPQLRQNIPMFQLQKNATVEFRGVELYGDWPDDAPLTFFNYGYAAIYADKNSTLRSFYNSYHNLWGFATWGNRNVNSIWSHDVLRRVNNGLNPACDHGLIEYVTFTESEGIEAAVTYTTFRGLKMAHVGTGMSMGGFTSPGNFSEGNLYEDCDIDDVTLAYSFSNGSRNNILRRCRFTNVHQLGLYSGNTSYPGNPLSNNLIEDVSLEMIDRLPGATVVQGIKLGGYAQDFTLRRVTVKTKGAGSLVQGARISCPGVAFEQCDIKGTQFAIQTVAPVAGYPATNVVATDTTFIGIKKSDAGTSLQEKHTMGAITVLLDVLTPAQLAKLAIILPAVIAVTNVQVAIADEAVQHSTSAAALQQQLTTVIAALTAALTA